MTSMLLPKQPIQKEVRFYRVRLKVAFTGPFSFYLYFHERSSPNESSIRINEI